jgi:hypothetical protein
MDLPPPLLPWASSLSLFPRDLSVSLGPLLRRLSAAMGPMRTPHHADQGEVDGFDGLTRRGNYDRCSVRWLLADEAPMSFCAAPSPTSTRSCASRTLRQRAPVRP